MNIVRKINSLSLFSTLFLILIFYIPFQKGYQKLFKLLFHDVSKTVGYLSLYVSELLIVLLFLVFLFARSPKRQQATPSSHRYLLSFLFVSLLSILCSSDRAIFPVYHSWLSICLPAALFFMISAHLDVKEALHKGLFIFLMAAFAQSAIAFTQYMYQGPLGLKYFGEPLFFPGFHIQEKTKWILDSFFNSGLLSKLVLRASGTFPHPNILGTFIGSAIFILFYFFTIVEKKRERFFLLLLLFVLEFVLFITYSRAALYGLGLGSLFWFGLNLWKGRAVKGLLIGFIISSTVSIFLLYPQLGARGGIFNYNLIAKRSDQERIVYQKAALTTSKDHRLMGVGLHHCFYNMSRLSKESQNSKVIDVHNIYLMVGSATGIVGLLCYLAFIGSILLPFRQGIDLLSLTLLTIFLFLLWIGCCDYLLIKSVHGRLLFFLFAGLLSAYKRETQPQNAAAYHK